MTIFTSGRYREQQQSHPRTPAEGQRDDTVSRMKSSGRGRGPRPLYSATWRFTVSSILRVNQPVESAMERSVLQIEQEAA